MQAKPYNLCNVAKIIEAINSEKVLLEPFFKDNYSAIAFLSSNYFVPYMTVSLQSVIENSSEKHNYDIIIFSKDMSESNKRIIKDLIKTTNFSIRFCNVSCIFEDLNLYTASHISIETYFRIIVPMFLKDYDKILILDGDIIVREDVAELYKSNITCFPLAATTDCLFSASVNKCKYTQDYVKNYLNVLNVEKYFQAGVMLINVQYFMEEDSCRKLLEMVTMFDYTIFEQDAMNELFYDKIMYLDNTWNWIPMHIESKYLENMSENSRKKYQAVKNPKILHFASEKKPWFYPSEYYANEWWAYAKQTPYYELIIKRMFLKELENQLNNKKNRKCHFFLRKLEKIFSVTNKHKYKVITILGLEIKMERHKRKVIR